MQSTVPMMTTLANNQDAIYCTRLSYPVVANIERGFLGGGC